MRGGRGGFGGGQGSNLHIGPAAIFIIALPLVFAARWIKRSPITVLKIMGVAGYLALCSVSATAVGMAPVLIFLGWMFRHGDED